MGKNDTFLSRWQLIQSLNFRQQVSAINFEILFLVFLLNHFFKSKSMSEFVSYDVCDGRLREWCKLASCPAIAASSTSSAVALERSCWGILGGCITDVLRSDSCWNWANIPAIPPGPYRPGSPGSPPPPGPSPPWCPSTSPKTRIPKNKISFIAWEFF